LKCRKLEQERQDNRNIAMAMPSGSDESPTSSMGSQVSLTHQSDNGQDESA
jgi:hypothetical protein